MRKPARADPRAAVAYVRTAPDDLGHSPEAQRAAIEAWALDNGVRILRWASEVAPGDAEVDERHELLSAIASLREARAGILLVAQYDRVATEAYLAAVVERRVAAVKSKIMSADGMGNDYGASDVFVRTCHLALLTYQRQMAGTHA